MMKKLFKVSTSYDDDTNFSSYNIIAENGTIAMAFVNLLIYKKRAKIQHERANEVEQIDRIDYFGDELQIKIPCKECKFCPEHKIKKPKGRK